MSPRFTVSPDRHYSDTEQRPERDSEYSEFEYPTVETDCPLCGEFAELDFHHWAYPPEDVIGTHLCRSCHLYIHEPDGARPSESVGNEWVRICIHRLVSRWVDTYPWLSPSFVEGKFSIPERYRGDLDRAVGKFKDQVEFFDPRPSDRRGGQA